ncbi:MAG: endonuclease/exonuclease/phosphatase family metal-dependent hydrolase [Polyangiales bacterium]|jgi:endonuclease/exonuclease/phosphatase family metal-dependent hydrolase
MRWLSLLVWVSACIAAVPPAAMPESRTPAARAEPSTEPVLLRMATFNIQVFGPTKAGKPEVMATLASIIRRYDLVAVQEIRDISGQAPQRLLEACNTEPSPTYALALSERTGREPDDRHSQEQYGYYYRTDRLAPVGEGTLYDDSAQDFFQREPFLQRFALTEGGRTFVMINVHTRPRSAVSEIAAMEQVFTWAKHHFVEESIFIAVGDFNAGCSYASDDELDALPIHGDAYDWVVPHSADTNLADSVCPYDRIVIAAPEGTDLVDEWGVDRAFDDRNISDHWPVWANLRFTR